MIPVVDPFMAGVPVRRPGDFTRSKQGTPYVSHPDGHLVKPKRKTDPPRIATTPYSRPSGFGKLIEDMYSIHKWDERQEAYGFAVAPELVERAKVLIEIEDRESQEWKDEADKIVKAAKNAAKSSIAADRGGHAHSLAEDDDEGRDIVTRIEAGEEMGLTPDVQRSLVAAWREMLARDGLEILAVEMPVVNDTYRAAGTLDRVARLTKSLRFRLCTGELITLPSGLIVILDIKSGKRRLNFNGTVMYWHGYAVQVFLYGPTSQPYDTETDTRGEWEWEIDDKWALIAHLDVLGAIDGQPSCELILADLDAGRRAADLCVAAKAWAAEATVFSVAQLEVEATQEVPVEGVGTSVDAGIAVPQEFDSPPAASTGTPDSPAASPVAAVTAGEGVGGSGPSPANSTCPNPRCVAGYIIDNFDPGSEPCPDCSRRAILTPDPARMALVDARASLTVEPDQGADLAVGFDELWDNLKALFDTLDPAARSWRSELVNAAQRHLVPFHVQSVRTERRYNINRGLIALCLAGGDNEEMLRALLALIIGDVALFPGVHAGHALGSLNATEAERFAVLVDVFNGPGLAAYIDTDGLFRLRELAA